MTLQQCLLGIASSLMLQAGMLDCELQIALYSLILV
jgi:hypothetical protein